MQFQIIRATKMVCKVIAGKAPNKSKHADLVKLSPLRLRKKAAIFTKPVFEALIHRNFYTKLTS